MSANGEPDLPKEYALYQNYPNPFNPTSTIKYTVGGIRRQTSGVSEVRLAIFDVLGREVAMLVDATKRPGRYAAMLDGAKLASGIYIHRVQAGSFVESKKLVIVR